MTTAKQGTPTQGQSQPADRSRASGTPLTQPADSATVARNVSRYREAAKLEEEDDEEEIPGHIQSFDASKRVLVVTLFNGKNRSFILAQNVPVHIKGAVAASRQGLRDPQLKAGAFVTVVTDDGGRKVKELKITPASEIKKKKAG
jgi:hypothetical protein